MKKVLIINILMVCSAVAAADALPMRKAGMWEMTITSSTVGAQPVTAIHCTDEATDKSLMGQVMANKDTGCAQSDIKKEGNLWTFSTQCHFNGTTMTSVGKVSGDFDSAYTVQSEMTFTPPMMGMAQDKSVITATYRGPCTEGLVPGDMRMHGMTINVNSIMPQSGKGIPSAEQMQKIQDMMKQMAP